MKRQRLGFFGVSATGHTVFVILAVVATGLFSTYKWQIVRPVPCIVLSP